MLHDGFLLGLFFDPEDGDNIFPQKTGWLSTDYTVLYPREQNSCSLIVPQVFTSNNWLPVTIASTDHAHCYKTVHKRKSSIAFYLKCGTAI
jgi:hypothetical protein